MTLFYMLNTFYLSSFFPCVTLTVDREIDQKILTVDVAFFAAFGMNSGVVKEACI